MEQHPVPQNVTTFQFRLIGDMTIKQFGYLAGGLILAYISYKLPLPIFFSWPLAILFALGGFGFAFVPVEERPMDVWVLSFLKNVYSPTQFIWQKSKPSATRAPAAGVGTAAHVSTPLVPHPAAPVPVTQGTQASPAAIHKTHPSTSIIGLFKRLWGTTGSAPQPSPIQPTPFPVAQPVPAVTGHAVTHDPLAWVKDAFTSTQAPTTTPGWTQTKKPVATATQPTHTPEPTAKREAALEESEQQLKLQVASLTAQLTTNTVSQDRIVELQQQLTEALTQKRRMEEELAHLHQQAQKTQNPPTAPTPVPPHPVGLTTTVRVVTPELAPKLGLPRLTTFPNVVTGIIKDGEGSLLPGVLVTIRDKEDVPQRALKTNKLGQFASSVPLPNGAFVVEVEDPRGRYIFDRAKITLTGAVMPPLEIAAKSQKQVSREKLANELFGNPMK